MENLNKNYIVELIKSKARLDGRKLDEYRGVSVETNVSKNAEGSARVRIGETEVIAGVKLGLGEPYPDSQDEGSIIVGAELLPLSSPEFEPGPPSIQATELARIVDRGIRESKALDFKKLCIKKGEKVWIVFIDIYTINDTGNLIDAAALASLVALKTAKYPKLEEDKAKKTYKVDYTSHTKALQLNKMPVTCTVYGVGDQILVDPSTDEELVTETRLSVAVLADGSISALQKGGSKGLSMEKVGEMIDLAIEATNKLRKSIP